MPNPHTFTGDPKKHRVFSHEGFWKPVPAESARYVVEDAFPPSTEVIEFNNLSFGRLVVICKDAAVGVFAFPQVKLTVNALLPFDYKTVCFPFLWQEWSSVQTQCRPVPPSSTLWAQRCHRRANRSGFRKDKGVEKHAESEEDLLEHRTDGTDAFDTLYIGCEKFPFHDSFILSVSGVSWPNQTR